MPTTFTAVVSSSVRVTAVQTAFPNQTTQPVFKPSSSVYAAGSTPGSIDGVAAQPITATTGGVSVNLHDGSLKDINGASIVAARVATLAIYNAGAVVVTLTGNFISTRFNSTGIPLQPGQTLLVDAPGTTGLVVTGTSADTITFTSASSTAEVDIVVTTCSA